MNNLQNTEETNVTPVVTSNTMDPARAIQQDAENAGENIVLLEEVKKKAKFEKEETITNKETSKEVLSAKTKISFRDFDLDTTTHTALERMGFTEPTPIQAESIPVALLGQDILGTAQTGTGKTAAYVIPVIEKLLEDPKATALILAPTRELASHILEFTKKLIGNKSMIRIALLIGGDSMAKQFFQLRAKPQIIVGTPGRINDHLNRDSLDLSRTAILVLDEADRMLDMGFGIQIDEILKSVPKTKQTLLFSATLPKEIIKLAEKYQTNPKRIAIGTANTPVAQIDQEVVRLQGGSMYSELTKRLDTCETSVIVFVNTKFGADKLADKLCDAGYEAQAIHGDLQQRKRERVIAAFRARRYNILIATDVAARGLDVPSVELVINFGLPQCPEDYIHRIGRTGRAGAKGKAVSFVTPEENRKWYAIERILNPGSSTGRSEHNGGGERRNNNRNDRFSRPARSNDRPRRFGGSGGGRDNRDRNDRFPNTERREERFEGPRKPREDSRNFNSDKVVDIRGYKPRDGFKKSASGSRDFRDNFRGDRDSRDFNRSRDAKSNDSRDFNRSRDSRDGDSRNFNRSRDSRDDDFRGNRAGDARKPYKKFGGGSGAKKSSGKPFPFPGYKKGGRPTLRKKAA